ncbi:MAG: hypothetical protein EOL97_14965 [Spirochaetia bacterium]|nr:hypothetical protein [Spirochaetia bacterium]
MLKNRLMVGFGLFLFLLCVMASASSLHNIDLSWNARYMSELSDDNGIIEQSVYDIYNRSVLILWIIPMFYLFSLFFILYGSGF